MFHSHSDFSPVLPGLGLPKLGIGTGGVSAKNTHTTLLKNESLFNHEITQNTYRMTKQ